MTIEEALTEIKERIHITEYVGSNYVDCVNIEALRIAIEALKNSERTEKSSQNVSNGDSISRKAAIDAICTEGTRLERNGTVAMAEIKQWCVDILEALPSAQPEGKRERTESAIEYCCDCIHVEMCSWYPHDGCEFVETGNYAKGYNDAKREIALSGEYERAYQRGFEDGRKSEWTAVAERGEQE